MVIIGERGLSGLVKYALDLMMLLVMIVLLTLPITVRMYLEAYASTMGENCYWFLLVFLWISGLLYMGIVYELRKMFKSLNQREPFTRENVAIFKKIAVLALWVSAIYAIKIVFYISLLTIVIGMAALSVGLCALIIGEVFRQAVEVKEENDLTI